MTESVYAAFTEMIRRGHMAGRRIIIIDDETKERNIYEDIDQETIEAPRLVVVTLEPSHSKAVADGDDQSGRYQTTLTHEKAISDIQKMLRFGWKIVTVERDLGERNDE